MAAPLRYAGFVFSIALCRGLVSVVGAVVVGMLGLVVVDVHLGHNGFAVCGDLLRLPLRFRACFNI